MSISAPCRCKKLIHTLAVVLSILASLGIAVNGHRFDGEPLAVDQDDVPDFEEVGPKAWPASHGRAWENDFLLAISEALNHFVTPAQAGLDQTPYEIHYQRHRAISLHLMGTSPPVQA